MERDCHIEIKQPLLFQLLPGKPLFVASFEALDDRVPVLIKERDHLIQHVISPGIARFRCDFWVLHGRDGFYQRGNPSPTLNQERWGATRYGLITTGCMGRMIGR